MAKLEKAQIKYMVGEGDGVESTLRFHSVISEEHEVTTEITKFPVQSGFNISNHAIKKNRKISITGVITNHLIIGAEEFHEYGGNNSRVMFSVLKDLVRGAVPCEVDTNYGSYSPVIFNRFKTKLQAGKTDIMEFTITGEEVQLGTTINGNAPTLLVFTPLTSTEREAEVQKLSDAGIEVSDDAVITVAQVDFNESFQVETTATNGDTILVTYDKVSYDDTTKTYQHEVCTSDTDLVKEERESGLNWFSIIKEDYGVDLQAGAMTASACLSDGAVGLATSFAEETVDTSLGKLKKTIYGAAYGILGVNGDKSYGQVLLALGVDCLVAGATGTTNTEVNADSFNDNPMPTWESALEGASSKGNALATDTLGVAAPTTLTKIASPSGTANIFGGG